MCTWGRSTPHSLFLKLTWDYGPLRSQSLVLLQKWPGFGIQAVTSILTLKNKNGETLNHTIAPL